MHIAENSGVIGAGEMSAEIEVQLDPGVPWQRRKLDSAINTLRQVLAEIRQRQYGAPV